MRDIAHTYLFVKSFSGFFAYVKNCFPSIFAISMVSPVFKYCLYHVLREIGGGWYIFVFDALFKPVLLIALFVVLSDYKSITNPSFYKKFREKFQSKYLKLLVISAVITFFSVYLGSGTVIFYSVIFLKMPFIEVMIFSSSTSILGAAKKNNSMTQDKLLRYLLVLLFSFLLARVLVIRGFDSINVSTNSEMISLTLEFARNIFVMLYFTYVFSLYNLIESEKMYPK